MSVQRSEAAAPASSARPAPAGAADVRPVASAAAPRRRGPGARLTILLLGSAALVAVNGIGAPYYLAPLAGRVRDPLHAWFKPSGYVGQSLGLLAAVLFFFLWLYPLRKKLGSRLAFAGRLPAWLDWHVAAGLLVPWIAATHAGWRFTGLIGLGYAAMFVVFLSGLAGRYLYARIPRRRDGLALSRDEIAAERERILFEFTAETGLQPDQVRNLLARDVESCEGIGLLATIHRMVADDFSRRRAARSLMRRLSGSGPSARNLERAALRKALRLARREMALAQHVRMLDATQRAFRYWHAAHKPVAITALIAVAAHIVVAILFGATWFY